MTSSHLVAVCSILFSGCFDGGSVLVPDPTDATDSPDVVDDTDVGPVAEHPPVKINELLAKNDSVIRDEQGDLDEWVELFNPTNESVDLSGWMLGDDPDDEPAWAFPQGTALEAGEFLIVWLDGDDAGLHAGFGLNADQDAVALFDPDGTLVDAIAFTDQTADLVLGRFPDGSPFVTESIFATPGASNPVDPGLSRDPSDLLFPRDQVIRVDLDMPDASYDALLADNHAEVEVGVTVLGTTLSPVMLRIKGGLGSRRDIDEKAAFRLNLDAFIPGARLRGQEHLTLNNMVQDSSQIHETITYTLFRDAGVPAPRSAYVELFMNGEYRGLYLNVETIDDQFLKRHFADPHGNLYEGIYGADVTPDDVDDMDLDEQGADDVDDGSELAALVAFLDQPPSEALMPEFEARIDVDRTLLMLAGEVITGHWDGYFYAKNNYRIYHEPSVDRWTLIPWGVDQTLSWKGNLFGSKGIIADWCLDVPSCNDRYRLALWEMAERLDQGVDLQAMEVYGRIRPYFLEDTSTHISPSSMTNGVTRTIEYAADYPSEVLEQLFPGGVP